MAPELTAQRKLKCDTRWKQINGALIQARAAAARTGEDVKQVGEEKIVEHDPVHAQLYQGEIAYQKRQLERANKHTNGHSDCQGR
jgi:hypothetical protein